MCQGMPGMEILARRGIATIPPCFDFNAGYQFNWGQFNWGQFNWGLSLSSIGVCPLLFLFPVPYYSLRRSWREKEKGASIILPLIKSREKVYRPARGMLRPIGLMPGTAVIKSG